MPERDSPSEPWTIELEYEFEFEFEDIATNAEAQRFGEGYVDEAIRTVILEELRDRRGLTVLVGIEALYETGSIRTWGVARALAELRDVPPIKEAFEQLDWFWIHLQIALGTKIGRKILLERKRAKVPVVHAGNHLAPGAAGAVLRRGKRIPPSRNTIRFTMWDRVGAATMFVFAAALLLLPYGCDYLDRRESERRWREHLSDEPISVSVAVSSGADTPMVPATSQSTGSPCRSRVNVTSYDSGRFTRRVHCLDK